MILGIHINSTAPFRARNTGAEYAVPDYELLCTMLSALLWKRHNGPMKLYADRTSCDCYRRLGLLDLWNEVDTEVLEQLPQDLDPQIYWAGAKLFAIRNEEPPFAVLDTDLIIWKPIEKFLKGKRMAVLHREPINEVYPPKNELNTPPGYVYDEYWDWTEAPCNCAFTYHESPQLKEEYTRAAIAFMRGNGAPPKDHIVQMVFAEQRLLAMCAKKLHIPVYSLLSHPFTPDNRVVTHLWGGKDIARRDPAQHIRLCRALAARLRELFPEFTQRHSHLEALRNYL